MKQHLRVVVGVVGTIALCACDRMTDSRYHSALLEADKRLKAEDVEGAIRTYETLLDGTAKTAEVHYRLGHLYADTLHEPLGALHHYARYIAIAPDGPYAKDVKSFQKEGELRLMNQLSKGSPLTQEEAARMKNENLALRKALAELRAIKLAPPAPVVPPGGAKTAKGEPVQKPIPAGARTHKVSAGDTLGSIAQKYYKNKGRWKDIQDANFYTIDGGLKLKPGQELIIP